MIDKRGIFWFIAITFCGSWSLAAWIWFDGEGIGLAKLLYMLTPAPAAFVVGLVASKQGFRDWGLRIGKKRLYAYAWLFPVGHSLFTYGLLIVMKKAEIGFSLQGVSPLFFNLGLIDNASSPWEVFSIVLFVSMTLGVLLTVPFAFGEEFGWRGYLLVRLLPLGRWRAFIVSGLVWGIWHAPLILMGHNFPRHPVAGVFVMMGTTVLLGIVFAWLRLEGGSVFLPTIAHASFNVPSTKPLLFLDIPDATLYSNFGIMGWVGMAVFIAFLMKTRRVYKDYAAKPR